MPEINVLEIRNFLIGIWTLKITNVTIVSHIQSYALRKKVQNLSLGRYLFKNTFVPKGSILIPLRCKSVRFAMTA